MLAYEESTAPRDLPLPLWWEVPFWVALVAVAAVLTWAIVMFGLGRLP